MRGVGSRLLLTVLAIFVGASCGEGVGDVNRVQPNYYKKSLFEGSWYFKQTVTEVPYEAAWVFEGAGSPMWKIRWEIQERYLIAYRENEIVIGANGHPEEKNTFTPVAAWPITSHFDIIRQYNPATGEQTNVLIEDMSDRPWHQRDYIRVDWARNQIANFRAYDFLIPGALLSGSPHWIQPHEEDNPDRAEITEDYISVVGLFDALPHSAACYAVFLDFAWPVGPGFDCAPATIKIRTSFKKIDPNKPKYEPLEYPDNKELLAHDDGTDGSGLVKKKLSICTAVDGDTCTAYADVPCSAEVLDNLRNDPFYGAYGYTEKDCQPAKQDYFNKFGYFRTERVIYDRERGMHEAGRRYYAKRWNIWESSYDENGDPIPFAERTVKPIVFHLNATFPEDMYGPAAEVARQWNEPFKETVAILQGKSVDEVPDVFVIEPNSCNRENVRQFVEKTPGAKKVAQRIIGGIDNLTLGNLRQLCAALEYNFDFHWQKQGDIRYSHVYWADRPNLVGPLGYGPSYEDPDTGEILHAMAYIYGAVVDTQASFGADIVDLITGRQNLRDFRDSKRVWEGMRENRRRKNSASQAKSQASEFFFDSMGARLDAFNRLPADKRFPQVPMGHFEAKFERLEKHPMGREMLYNGEWELLTTPQHLMLPGLQALAAPEPKHHSMTELFTGDIARKQQEAFYKMTSEHCMLPASFVDDTVIGLAMEFDPKTEEDRAEVLQYFREQIFIAVMLHEIGHTIGLRHNFAGSQDPLNYFDEFWDYLELDPDPFTARNQTNDPQIAARLERCIDKANSWDVPVPETMHCLRGREVMQASIMDYGSKPNSDFAGVGKYDRAAIAFGYGQLVEVFDEDVVAALPQSAEEVAFAVDYKKYPQLFQGKENIRSRSWMPYDEYQRRLSAQMSEVAENLPRIQSTGGNTYACTQNCGRAALANEVPYRFCSDELRHYFGVPHCRYFDEGANQVESINAMIDQVRDYYFFTAFRRGRFGWNPTSHMWRLQGRFAEMVRTYQYFHYYSQFYGPETDIFRDYAEASIAGLNFLGETLQTPEPGEYCLFEDGVFRRSNRCGAPVEIPMGVGHPFWQEYTDDYPYYQIEMLGSYYEKLQAIIALTSTYARFPMVSDESRAFSLSYYRLFPDEVMRVFGGLIGLELDAISGEMVQDEDGGFSYRPVPIVDPQTYGTSLSRERGPIVAPAISLDHRDWALLLGMVFFNSTYDDTVEFREFLQVSVKGSEDDFDYGWVDKEDPEQYVEFVNPSSRKIYRAAASPRSQELSYGYRVVREAKEIYENYWVPLKQALEEAERALDEAVAPWEVELAQQTLYEVRRDFSDVDAALNRQVELLDRIRFLQQVVGVRP